MNQSNDGLSIWYNTADAPAPAVENVARRGIRIVVGASPANPTNVVTVQFRVDTGLMQSIPARALRTDWSRGVQYFIAELPPIPRGRVVEYIPILSCAGRQVPAAHLVQRSMSRFSLADNSSATSAPASSPTRTTFSPQLTFVASVFLDFEPVRFLGEQADGVRVNFVARGGCIEGQGIRGKVLEHSADLMLVRSDGMGVANIAGVFETQDGALLDVRSGGYVDFGQDGYRQALAQRLPDRSPIVLAPLITTSDARYAWLNRIQCVASGETHLNASRASYHVYAAGRSTAASSAS